MEEAHQTKHHYDDLSVLNADVKKVINEKGKQPFYNRGHLCIA